jgi:8-oxo-dGTP pyrophosphatase MutT (NUDIX family)
MNFEHFIRQLTDRLTQPLPGEEGQLKMAPVQRKDLIEYYRAGSKDPMQSAVLVCLYPHQNSIYTVLMLRPAEQGAHSDQVSFPGGRFEEADGTLEVTALRETHEELGIEPDSLTLVGKLTPVYIPVSNFQVHPFVAASSKRPQFSLNKFEVKKIIEEEMGTLFNDATKGHGAFVSASRWNIEAPYYEVQQHKIWGATAMILSELENIILPLLTAT